MKRKFFYFFIMLFVGLVSFTACNNDDEIVLPDNNGDNNGDKTELADGFYVYNGDVTTLADIPANGLMMVTNNETDQTERASLFETFYKVDASIGFYIIEVSNGTVYYMGSTDAASVEAQTDEPQDGLYKGTYGTDSVVYKPAESGVYHIVIDSELGLVTYAVANWGIIGAGSPGGWSSSTPFDYKSDDDNTIVWEGTNIELKSGDIKFRYSNGWKIFMDETVGAEVNVNTNLGGAIDALTPGGANIAWSETGLYTITLTFNYGTGFTVEITKTGDSSIKDYTDTELGLVGDGIIVADTANGWNYTMGLMKPEVSNTKYTWKWTNIQVSEAGSFKIREGQTWDNISLGYPQVTVEGGSADNFGTNNDGNFVPVAAGNFDITLVIEASTETYTVKIEAAGTAEPEMYMLGDGCSAGWDNTIALPMSGTGGVYTITTALTSGANIKFITTLGQWAPMYGTDANGTSSSGNLVYRPTENDTDPASIPTPDTDGTYTVSINTNDLTYTITAK